MGVRKEWQCPGHGAFESDEPRCPYGCSIPVDREFRTAPAVHGQMTARTDQLLRSQVEAFGLSNIRSSREGETARIASPQESKMAEFQKAVRTRYPKFWGELPKGAGAIPAVLDQHHAPATTGIDKAALAASAPRVERIRDPENLQVKTA